VSNYSGVLHFLVLSRRVGLDAPVEVPTALAQIVRRPLRKNSFLGERRGNLYENKGPLWKTEGPSWNVYENKGT
jgi:hypothetical protein